MIDNDMTNILRNFSGAEAGTGEIVDAGGQRKVSTAATEKNAMKSLLEGLDSAQKSVNQMPGTHTMAKSTDTAHPAEKFLVGGEFDEETNLSQDEVDLSKYQAQTNEGGYGDFDDDPTDTSDLYPMAKASKYAPGTPVHLGHMTPHGSGIEGEVVKVVGDVIYIKNAEGQQYKGQLKNATVNESWMDKPGSGMLDADIASTIQDEFPQDDMLDIMAWEASAEEYGQPLTVEEYTKWRMYDDEGNIKDTNEDTIAKRTTGSDVHKKQSFADIFRSMDETEEDMAGRFKKELHDEKTAKALSKGDNGKFNLAEEEDTGWGDELIEALKLLLQQNPHSPYEVVAGVEDLIQQYEAPSINQDQL